MKEIKMTLGMQMGLVQTMGASQLRDVFTEVELRVMKENLFPQGPMSLSGVELTTLRKLDRAIEASQIKH